MSGIVSACVLRDVRRNYDATGSARGSAPDSPVCDAVSMRRLGHWPEPHWGFRLRLAGLWYKRTFNQRQC
jgi:hypothetical protein